MRCGCLLYTSRELMTTGFRYRSTAQVYAYNKYDASAIDYTQLTGQPDISTIPVSYTHLDVYKRQGQDATQADDPS